nr:ABC transporter permease [Brevibacterium yomogidense]
MVLAQCDGTQLSLSAPPADGINIPWVTAGTPVDSGDGVWIDDGYARAHDLDPGDTLTATVGDTTLELTVRGLVLLPDKIAFTGTARVAPDPQAAGYGLVSAGTLDLLPPEAVQQTILVRGDLHDLADRARDALGPAYTSYADRDSHPHVATAFERVAQIRSLSYLFSGLFLLVALLSITTSLRRLTDVQRSEVATLKALGVTNARIGGYYTAMSVVPVLVGSGAGLALTPALSRFVLATQRGSFSLPVWETDYSALSLLLPAGLLLACVAAAWSATRSTRRMSPAEGLRPDIGRARRTPVELMGRLWDRVGYGARWSVRDATTNPVRVLLGIVATAGCMMLLVAGFGMPATLDQQVQTSYSQQYLYDTRVQVSPAADEALRARLNQQGGQWIQQTTARIDDEDAPELTLTVLGTGDLFRLLDGDGDPLPASDGAVVSAQVAHARGLGVGDDITVTLGDGTEAQAEITALTSVSEPQGVAFTAEAWKAAGGAFHPNAFLSDSPTTDDVASRPGVIDTVSLVDQQANAQALVDSLGRVFTLIKVFAIVLSVVVLYNLGALSFTERIRDYATLRVLGFHHGELRSLAARENAATTLVGWLIGIPAGWWFLRTYVSLFSTDRAAYTPAMGAAEWAWASVITIAFAMTATLLLTRRINGIDMTSALKGVE